MVVSINTDDTSSTSPSIAAHTCPLALSLTPGTDDIIYCNPHIVKNNTPIIAPNVIKIGNK